MIVTEEISLRDFEPWQGAIPTFNALSEDELDQLERELEMKYPNGIDKTELNDLFWFDEDYIFTLAGHVEEEEDEDDDC